MCAEVCTESQSLCCSAKRVTNQKLHLNYVATPRKASCRHYKERDNNWLHTKTTSRKHSRCVSQRQYGVIWHLINRRRKNRCFKCQRGVNITTEQQREPFWSSNNMTSCLLVITSSFFFFLKRRKTGLWIWRLMERRGQGAGNYYFILLNRVLLERSWIPILIKSSHSPVSCRYHFFKY